MKLFPPPKLHDWRFLSNAMHALVTSCVCVFSGGQANNDQNRCFLNYNVREVTILV